jgi:hypothetical protein
VIVTGNENQMAMRIIKRLGVKKTRRPMYVFQNRLASESTPGSLR